jgi:hypothetical protein
VRNFCFLFVSLLNKALFTLVPCFFAYSSRTGHAEEVKQSKKKMRLQSKQAADVLDKQSKKHQLSLPNGSKRSLSPL